jgi:hypothetical protein
MFNMNIYLYIKILLGAPTIGGGSAWPRGGGGGCQRSQISLQSHPEYTKMAQKWHFPALNDLKNATMPFFNLQVLYFQDVF